MKTLKLSDDQAATLLLVIDDAIEALDMESLDEINQLNQIKEQL